MTKFTVYSRLALVLALLLWGCTGTLYVNKSYSRPGGMSKLAIVPVGDQYRKVADELFEEKFSGARGVDDFVSPADIREKIAKDEKNAKVAADQKLKRILNKISEKIYSSTELKENLGLKSLLSNTEQKYLREKLDDASLIMFPVVFTIMSGAGYIKVRLYDLSTGEFIYENSMEVNTQVQEGEKKQGAGSISKSTISLLLDRVKTDFETNLP